MEDEGRGTSASLVTNIKGLFCSFCHQSPRIISQLFPPFDHSKKHLNIPISAMPIGVVIIPRSSEALPIFWTHWTIGLQIFSSAVSCRLSEVWSWTRPQMSRSRSRYGWTWTWIIDPGQLVNGPVPDQTSSWVILKIPFKTSQRTYYLDNYLQRYGQNNKNYQK